MISRAQKILLECMDVKQSETVLVITDDSTEEIGNIFYMASAGISCESLLMKMKDRKCAGQEPPQAIAEAMKYADVVLCPTKMSLTHTNARIEALKAGARIATLPGIDMELFEAGALQADYIQIEERSEQIAGYLTAAERAVLIKDQYRLEFGLGGRRGIASTGRYRRPGSCGNLPSGEAYIAPVETEVNGSMLIDGSMVGIGVLEEPVLVEINSGEFTNLCDTLFQKIEVLNGLAANRIVAELGIGTNDKARLTGNILEDEKVMGTVHIAFGTNTSFGGVNKAECHLDGVIVNPTLWLDDKLILDRGVLMV